MTNKEIWIRDLHKLMLEMYGFRIMYLEKEGSKFLAVVSRNEHTSCGSVEILSNFGEYPIVLGQHEASSMP